MISLLSKLFIKDYKNYTDSNVRTQYGVLCGGYGIFLNILLFVAKFIAGTISASVAMVADAFNNLSDAASSVVNILGFKLASKKPDPEHPFGHGRMEYVSGLVISGLIFLMAFELNSNKSKEIYDIKNSKFCLPMKTNDLIQSCIYNSKNYWDAGLLAKVDKILKNEAVILDIGANIGNHTLYWAKERNAKKIYSFEPYPYSYRILQKNVEINDLENIVTTCPFGISDKEAKGSVVTFCPTNIGGLKFENDVNGDFDFKPLDSLNIKEKIDLIKIDVEGAELEVLNGGIETIKRNRPIIIIETFDKKETIEKLLYSIGYEFYDDNRAMCDYIYYCREKKYMSVLKSFIKRCTFH